MRFNFIKMKCLLETETLDEMNDSISYGKIFFSPNNPQNGKYNVKNTTNTLNLTKKQSLAAAVIRIMKISLEAVHVARTQYRED